MNHIFYTHNFQKERKASSLRRPSKAYSKPASQVSHLPGTSPIYCPLAWNWIRTCAWCPSKSQELTAVWFHPNTNVVEGREHPPAAPSNMRITKRSSMWFKCPRIQILLSNRCLFGGRACGNRIYLWWTGCTVKKVKRKKKKEKK